MLYYLSSYINIFHYITFRAILAFFIAFFVSVLIFPKFIKWAKNRLTQPIYQEALKNHISKENTPTMGGVIVILSAVFATLLSAKFNFYVIITIFTALIFMAIGLIDDLRKIRAKKNQEGLSKKEKLIYQFSAAFIITAIIYFHGFDTRFFVPFYKHPLFDMKFFAIFFWSFVIVGMSNAVNLTDGLDGLATIPSIFSLATLSVFLYLSGNYIFSKYLFLPFEFGVGELVVVIGAFIGALLGFLWYNAHPAEIFMGDSGSLAIGAIIGLLGIFAKSEILLGLIGFVFILETISVILQIGSNKTFGKRIFKKAPIHHHFEELNWKENHIVIRFWIIALITNIIALMSLKIR
jgi:phospho-N-acetylmuramoyl-pentapeptide-transferase